MARLAALLVMVAACGRGAGAPAVVRHDDARAATARDAVGVQPELGARPLGQADLDAFQWRKRAGQPAFRTARRAEGREDWPAVVDACKQALAADPTHLEAAWLYAVALAKTGKVDEVLAPLALAATGDFGKWATASLEQPALQPFLATPSGEAWRRSVARDGQAFALATANAALITAHGDLYAYDAHAGRYHRLTRTYGSVVGALVAPAAHAIAYVTRGKKSRQLAVGLVHLDNGHSTRPQPLAGAAVRVASAKQGFVVRTGTTWQLLADDGTLGKLAAAPAVAADAPALDVTASSVRLRRAPVDGITADWDDQQLASALKLRSSGRIVTVPSPGQIDRTMLAWSPDRTHLAFVAVLDERCTPGAATTAVDVVDAATGKLQELARATGGSALAWLDDRTLVIAGDAGVSLVALGAGDAQPVRLEGADGLVVPRRSARCTPEPADTDEPTSDDPTD